MLNVIVISSMSFFMICCVVWLRFMSCMLLFIMVMIRLLMIVLLIWLMLLVIVVLLMKYVVIVLSLNMFFVFGCVLLVCEENMMFVILVSRFMLMKI